MPRPPRRPSSILFLAALALGPVSARADDPPKQPDLTAAQKQRLVERDQHGQRAQTLAAQGKTAEAIAEAEAMLKIERDVLGDNNEDVAGSLELLGDLHLARDEWDAARRDLDERLAILTKLYGPKDWRVADARRACADVDLLSRLTPVQRRSLARVKTLDSTAIGLYQASRYADAIPPAREASTICKEVLGERHPGYATRLGNLALVYMDQGDLKAARPLLEQALAIDKEVLGERHPAYATSLNNLASVLKAQGDLDAARPLLERALAITKVALGERHQAYATRLTNLAGVLEAQGDLDAARSLYEQAVVVMKAAVGERHPDYATVLNNLGLLLAAQGNLDAARPLCERALAITKEVLGERHPAYATSLSNLAGVLKTQWDLKAARPLLEHALAITKEALGERHPAYARSLNNLAFVLMAQGDLKAARPLLEQALAIHKEVLGERHPAYATSLSNLAIVLREQGDLKAARPLLERAVTLTVQARGEHHPDYVAHLQNLARVLKAQGELNPARSLFERAVVLTKEARGERRPGFDTNLLELAVISWEQGEPREAREKAEEALNVGREGIVGELTVLSSRQLLTRIQASEVHLHFCLSLSAAGPGPGPAEKDYAELLGWKGLMAEAAGARRAAMGDKATRKASVEGARARMRLQQLYQAVVPKERADEHAKAIRKAVDELEARETELAKLIRWDVRPPTIDRLLGALPADAGFVDVVRYVRFRPPGKENKEWGRIPSYAAFVIRPGAGVARVELGPAAAIENAVAAWRERVKDDGREGSTTGRAVRRLLWEPIEPYVKGARVVLVAPDGALNFVPWGALPDGEGSYLVKHHAFATVGSGRQLIAMAKGRPQVAQGGLLAVGGIDYGAEPGASTVVASRAATVTNEAIVWNSLDGARAEAEEVADLFRARHPGAAATPLAGAEATRDRMRREMTGRRYLHLATHGYFAPPELKSALRPPDDAKTMLRSWEGMGRNEASGWFPELLSGLVWAGANRPVKEDAESILEHDNGAIMTAEEVSGLDLKGCELAVLSACETGLGQTAGGEGVLGLQRAFAQAGCRTVIASLWKVDDGATRDLMASFYGHLWEDRMTPLEALRAAQLELLDDPATAHPAYWAAWSLGGDPGNLPRGEEISPQRTRRTQREEK